MNSIHESIKAIKLKATFSWDRLPEEQAFIWNLEKEVLPDYLGTCRWFAGKARKLEEVKVKEIIPFPLKDDISYLLIIETLYWTGKSENYLLPLTLQTAESVDLHESMPKGILATLKQNDTIFYLTDGAYNEHFRRQIFNCIVNEKKIATDGEELVFEKGSALVDGDEGMLSRMPDIDSSNTTIIYGEKYFFKLYRKLFEEINTEVELVCFLSEKTSFSHIPAYAGSFYRRHKNGTVTTLGLLQQKVEGQENCWELVLDYLSSFNSAETSFENQIELLGLRTAEMHIALGSDNEKEALIPEVFNDKYCQWLAGHFESLVAKRVELLENNFSKLDKPTQELANHFLKQTDKILEFFASIKTRQLKSFRTRIHGDYHLGQVLFNGSDFIILDFEGEPESSVRERKIKHSPLKDVAGMLRSFHYAVSAKVFFNTSRITNENKLLANGEEWLRKVSEAYLSAYFSKMENTGLLETSSEEKQFLLKLHLLEKAIYELGYELNSRPDWVKIPLKGIESVLKDIIA